MRSRSRIDRSGFKVLAPLPKVDGSDSKVMEIRAKFLFLDDAKEYLSLHPDVAATIEPITRSN